MQTTTQPRLKVNELRVGNILIDPLTKAYLRVSELTDEGKIVSTVIDRSKFPLPEGWSTEPILLTPEILEKTSLKYSDGFDDVKGWEIAPYVWLSRLTESKWYVGFEETDNDQSHKLTQISEVFEHLHQLQNLYFALTREELQINL